MSHDKLISRGNSSFHFTSMLACAFTLGGAFMMPKALALESSTQSHVQSELLDLVASCSLETSLGNGVDQLTVCLPDPTAAGILLEGMTGYGTVLAAGNDVSVTWNDGSMSLRLLVPVEFAASKADLRSNGDHAKESVTEISQLLSYDHVDGASDLVHGASTEHDVAADRAELLSTAFGLESSGATSVGSLLLYKSETVKGVNERVLELRYQRVDSDEERFHYEVQFARDLAGPWISKGVDHRQLEGDDEGAWIGRVSIEGQQGFMRLHISHR